MSEYEPGQLVWVKRKGWMRLRSRLRGHPTGWWAITGEHGYNKVRPIQEEEITRTKARRGKV